MCMRTKPGPALHEPAQTLMRKKSLRFLLEGLSHNATGNASEEKGGNARESEETKEIQGKASKLGKSGGTGQNIGQTSERETPEQKPLRGKPGAGCKLGIEQWGKETGCEKPGSEKPGSKKTGSWKR